MYTPKGSNLSHLNLYQNHFVELFLNLFEHSFAKYTAQVLGVILMIYACFGVAWTGWTSIP